MSLTRYGKFSPIVHPTAYVAASAELIGEVEIGEEASIWPTCVLRGDNGSITVGARSNFQDGSIAHATLGISTSRIGADCTIGHRVIIHGCSIGDHCLIGMGSIVLDGVDVGEWSFVAAGSLLAPGKKYPPRSFILGSPGKRVREVTETDLNAIIHGGEVYREIAKAYRTTTPSS